MLTKEQELYITRAMLLGCTFVYDNFGHPERAQARKYYQCKGSPGAYTWCTVTGYGHTEWEAARDWLRRTGNLTQFA